MANGHLPIKDPSRFLGKGSCRRDGTLSNKFPQKDPKQLSY